MNHSFDVAVDRGIRLGDGTSSYPLASLEASGIEWRFFDERVDAFSAAQLEGVDAVIVGGAAVPAAAVDTSNPPLLLARLGAGYDEVAVEACTERGILVTTAPDGVRRAMASAGIALLLALAHRLVEKDGRTRRGVWDRSAIGPGLSGKTLGVLGLGNIGRDLCGLAAPFALRRIGHDKFAPPVEGVESVDLETLLAQSDYLIITLPLNDETDRLMNADRIAKMKAGSYLINIARGQIVDQRAVAAAVAGGHLAGAALDVFEHEPLPLDDPLLTLDNVILTGHDAGLTAEMTNDVARSACRSVIDVFEGRVPRYVLNPAALDHPRLARLARP
jgi:phosphoglycerate dehydrogenase-like enzyme